MKPGYLHNLRDEDREPLPEFEVGDRAPEHVFCPYCDRELDPEHGLCLVCKKSLADLGLSPSAASPRRAGKSGALPDLRALLSIVGLAGLVIWAASNPNPITMLSVLFAAVPWGPGIVILQLARVARQGHVVLATRAGRRSFHDGLLLYIAVAVLVFGVAAVGALTDAPVPCWSLMLSASSGILSAVYLIAVVRTL